MYDIRYAGMTETVGVGREEERGMTVEQRKLRRE
jgi:hypothetical protein